MNYRVNLNINENTPIGNIPLEVMKDIVKEICGETLSEYIKRMNAQEDKGNKVVGIKEICSVLGVGKNKFLKEVKTERLNGVVFQTNKHGIWWGWEKDLQRKSAELYATRKKKNQ